MSDRHHDHRPRNYGRENTFRAFIALDIEPEAKKELARISAAIKSQCHGSFPPTESYHMTMAFLGDITPTQADAICRVLEEVAEKYEPFELKLCRLGYFAQPESATVFCFTERDNTLFDDKPFRAHITLGRRVDLSTIRLNSIEVNHVPFMVRGLTLYKSILHQSGPNYQAMAKIDFEN